MARRSFSRLAGRIVTIAFLLLCFDSAPALAQMSSDALESFVDGLEWRNIGPTIMGGRVADVAVLESNPSVFYVGTATGGVWKTVNHGTTFEPVFDHEATPSIGDVTLAPSNPNIVWVGTGEPQNRQSSPWGYGVYKSVDAGRTWSHKGLQDTHHISRIQIHPTNPDVVYVAAVGRLWGSSLERGVYRSMDGGESWERLLFIDENTGAIDLIMDPGDPQTLFAAMYQRRRTGWGFNGGGPGSGIYRTTDGGASWVELTEGLPQGDMGRIGLDIFRSDPTNVFAVVEADPREPGQRWGEGREDKNGVYRSRDRGDTWEQLSTTNNRPMYYSQIRVDPNDLERIYLGGADLYRSSDGGRTFTDDAAEDVHSDHHALWINPANSSHLVLAGDGGVSITWDRGENWRQLTNLPLAQFYEIGVDMRDPYYVCGGLQDNGSWCGPSDTWSTRGIRPNDWHNVGGGDGFYTVMHPDRPGVMFVESQGGNVARVDLTSMESLRMQPVARPLPGQSEDEERELRWNWDTPIVWSEHDANTVYVGANVLFRSRDLGSTWEEISPDLTHAIDREELDIMGVKGSEPQMSMNDGQSSYGNLETIAESPLNPDLLYTGSDDGKVYVTRDGGATWTDLTDNIPGVPERTYVSRLVASRYREGTVYATFDGHRNNDFAAYVYSSDDYGASWRQITDGLPQTSVNVIAEHPRTAGLLFLGNELGAYFSVDDGGMWARLGSELPTVPVDDIKIHPRDNDLVLGTHGRGIWIMDDITPLEHLSASVLAADAHLFPIRRATSLNVHRPQGWTPGEFMAPNAPTGAMVRYHLARDLEGAEGVAVTAASDNGDNGRSGRGRGAEDQGAEVVLTILDQDGSVVRELAGPGTAGLHQVVWDLRVEPAFESDDEEERSFYRRGVSPRGPRVLPGTYTVRLQAGDERRQMDVPVRLDPRIDISDADLRARQDAMMSAFALAGPIHEGTEAIDRLEGQLEEVEALLDEHAGAPDALVAEVSAFLEDLSELREDLEDASDGARASWSIEASTTAPTADQLWQIDQSWNRVPAMIERLNDYITERMPAINRQLDEQGVRPDPGGPVAVPRRSGDA